MRTLLCILVLLSLVGCSQARGLEVIQKLHPECDVVEIPEVDHRFIVRHPDGSVYVEYSSGTSSTDHVNYVKLLGPIK